VTKGSEANDEEVGVEASECRPLRNGGSKLDKIDAGTSKKELSSKTMVSEVPNKNVKDRKEEKLSDLNIMDTFVIVLTIILTIKTNLAIAVLAGALVSNFERYIRNKFFCKCVCTET